MSLSIGVYGLGFVGLTTALGLAEKGFTVKGFDVNEDRSDSISKGVVPFFEPGMDDALKRNFGKNYFMAKDAQDAAKDSDVLMFCVGTPCGEEGTADLAYLYSALDSVMPLLNDGRFRVLVIKSTVPPGTTSKSVIPYLKSKGFPEGENFAVANNPEFLREGKCWDDFMNPDRIVCGVNNEKAAEILREMYHPFGVSVHITSHNTGEFIKYLSNTLLATLISYSNEMSIIANGIGGIDIGSAFSILHEDKRWCGANITSYIYPGCGYGGYCLPKDVQAVAAQAKAHGVDAALLKQVISVNNQMPEIHVQKIQKITNPSDPIGILGLSFKPDSDDVRDSPAAKIIHLLQEFGYHNIYAYDPIAYDVFHSVYGFENIHYCKTKEEVCEKSVTIALVTTWSEFKGIDKAYPNKSWIDCRYYL